MPNPDSSSLRIHLLDVGTEKYGDCLVCELGDRKILIDGAHAGDYKDRGDRPSIPSQLEELFGHAAPFKFDLLVVTHCHADHIGCLPTLVAQDTIEAEWALLADETLGFGRSQDFQPPPDDALTISDKLAAALREEDYSHLPDDELEHVLEDLATLESRYGDMLAALDQKGTKLVRYDGTGTHKALEAAFKDFGLKVLGPTAAHLKICSQAIARFNDRSSSDVARMADADLASIYRSIVSQPDAAGAEDRPGKGAALNDQSIVLKLSVGGATALLAGDMQFAKPEISGITASMKTLRQSVKAAGPYRFIKLTHHSSYNGFDDSLLQDWSPTNHYAHTGGLNDADHPDPGVLQLLDQNTARLQWARTDRNGKITVTFPADGPNFEIAFGKLNDPTPNGDAISQVAPATAAQGSRKSVPSVTVARSSGGIAELTATAKVGPDVTRVTVTFELSRSGSAPIDVSRASRPASRRPTRSSVEVSSPLRLASGRKLPKLLFVTYRARLENNIGSSEAAAALQLIKDGNQTVYEVQTPASPWPEVRSQLNKTDYAGIVVLGGYDVLPSQRLDVIPPSLRPQLSSSSDADNFLVWNDEAYGDKDGDLLPEIPVTRIPDAKTPRLVMAALTAGGSLPIRGRFGVRNIARPFAVGPYNLLPGNVQLLVSQTASPTGIGPQNASGDIVYFMLHGSDTDATRFWGEDGAGAFEAVSLTNVPNVLAGVVFAGCCWGALTVDRRASTATTGQPLGTRTPGQSMALSYLHAGARAFVGCTGTHYSPTVSPYTYFGQPMHVAFFKRLMAGEGPAQALFNAKVEYASGMPHGQNSNVGKAVEFKIWKEFTCLGLGW